MILYWEWAYRKFVNSEDTNWTAVLDKIQSSTNLSTTKCNFIACLFELHYELILLVVLNTL